jgi:hypothetical protein
MDVLVSFATAVLQVFYGREVELQRINKHLLGACEKPMVLYGEGGCGKTSLLSKAAGLASTEWFQGAKPISIIRFLGTTPDSSALTPTLVSICQQVTDPEYYSREVKHLKLKVRIAYNSRALGQQ